MVNQRSADDLCYDTEFAAEFFVDGVQELLDEVDMPEDKRAILRVRLAELVDR